METDFLVSKIHLLEKELTDLKQVVADNVLAFQEEQNRRLMYNEIKRACLAFSLEYGL